jgi:heptosyltransferase III
MVPDAITSASLRRALVIKLRHHGDVLLSAPVFSTLKRLAPQCEIDALIYADTAPMLDGHPAIAQIHRIDRNWKREGAFAQASAEWRLFRALRERRYDLIIHLTEHRRGAWLTRLLGPRWSVAPRQNNGFWRKSFSHFYPWASNPRRHTVETNLDALRRIGLQPTDDDKRVVLVPGAAAEARIDALLAEQGLTGRAFVHIHPASRWLFKCWPADRMAQLADALAARGLAVVLTAAPDPQERGMIEAIRGGMRSPVVDLAGQLSLKQMAALSARAKLFVGVDSAPMHIAAAMGAPTVALFGPSGDIEWGPWRTAHRVVASTIHPCRPCGQDGCGGGKISECLTTLPVERVLAACDELL